MAITICPQCGQEISDKAKKCIRCGKVLIEEEQPKKFCSECGKEIPADTQECPFCGCPIEQKTNITIIKTKCLETMKKHKKPLIIATILSVVAILAGLIVGLVTSSLNEDEQLAYQNAVKMQSMMRDPDSFKLYDEMFLLKKYAEDGSLEYTYTIFKYGGANGYGAITTDEAIFKDGKYIMDYADEPDEDDADYMDKLFVKLEIAVYILSGDTDTLKKVDIDIEKIKNKMRLES